MDIDVWVKWISIGSSIATVIIAWSALYVANKQLKLGWEQLNTNISETKNATAHNLYHQYLSMCIDKPEFAYGMEKPEERTIDYGKYCWFVSSMLFTFEQILETNSLDTKWIDAIKSQLLRHRKFLAISSTVRERNWNDKLQNIINEVIL
ncbi:hypothetical protein ACW5WK_19905 [Aeromonas enteropelogenes]|uniref:hypothetical protein n=1 Tax=Aeromonas enteropelogenes TaxID=29489 RepID=UPI0005A69986|nr:hypothetical protein [Aeromonas enteropelogenes]UBH57444.1 hypothetical protein LA341_05905 [Aeromonas enteropelogenes]